MTGGIRFVRAAAVAGDPGPQPLRYASINGRQLFAMVHTWPELGNPDRLTGIYHAAAGREKAQIKAMGRNLVVQQGFDVLKPAAMVFEHVPLGPLAQLAIALGCKGPFWSIEADELAGPTAALQALEDLAEGRCDQALVASYDFDPPAARAFLLVRDDAAELAWHARFTAGGSEPPAGAIAAIEAALGAPATLLLRDWRPGDRPEGGDPLEGGDRHGLDLVVRAFELAQSGRATAVWRQVPDGRGLLLGIQGSRTGTGGAVTAPVLAGSSATDRPGATIPELLAARVAQRPDATLLIDALTGESRTYAQAALQAHRWAEYWRSQGLGHGSRVAVVLPNSLDFAELFQGAALGGVTLSPYNPALSDTAIAALIRRYGARLALTTASRAPDLAGAVGIPICTIGSRGELPAGLPPVPAAGAAEPAPVGPDSLITLIMTSGTTGGVKACRITHASVCWTAAQTAAAFGLGPESRYLTPLPLYHINAQVVGLLAAIRAGGAVALGPRLPALRLWEAAARVGATGMSTVPAIVHDLLDSPGEAPPGLRYIVCSSAALPQAARERFEARFGIPVLVCYGLSEAGCFVSYGRPGLAAPPNSVGVPLGCDVRIAEGGEILVRGAGVFAGYDGDAPATAAALRDGWLHTGDQGELRPGGHLVLHGRIKELINRGGEKIAPDAIEAVLRECPGIQDAAVFGIPDDRLTEEVAAAVVLRPEATLTDDDLWEFCAGRLADFETPKIWLRRVDLPRGPTGKVLRRALQEDYVRCKAL